MTTEELQFHWAALKGDPDFEPALIDYEDGEPVRVWFIGNEFEVDASRCVIAERITRKETS